MARPDRGSEQSTGLPREGVLVRDDVTVGRDDLPDDRVFAGRPDHRFDGHARTGDGDGAVPVELVVRVLDVESKTGTVTRQVEQALVRRDDELGRQLGQDLSRGWI